jgi:hypothetical protein
MSLHHLIDLGFRTLLLNIPVYWLSSDQPFNYILDISQVTLSLLSNLPNMDSGIYDHKIFKPLSKTHHIFQNKMNNDLLHIKIMMDLKDI